MGNTANVLKVYCDAEALLRDRDGWVMSTPATTELDGRNWTLAFNERRSLALFHRRGVEFCIANTLKDDTVGSRGGQVFLPSLEAAIAYYELTQQEAV